MRATYQSQYVKNGSTMHIYAVTGTKAELEKFCAIQETATGRAAGTWQKTPAGLPLYWANATQATRSGRTLGPTLNLIFNFDDTRVIVDNSAADMARANAIAELQLAEEAKLMAQIRLGLLVVPRTNRSFTAPTRTAAPVGENAIEAPDLTEEIMSMVGADGGEPGSEPGAEELGG